MLRWLHRSFRLRPRQVAYYDEHTPLVDERGNTMLLASIRADRSLMRAGIDPARMLGR
jgi:hypothetical protein